MLTSGSEGSTPPVRDLLAGKRLLITGIATEGSIAHATAARAVEQGATVVATAMPRDLEGARAALQGLGTEVPVLPMDATDPADVEAVRHQLEAEVGTLDGALHAIAFSPRPALGAFLDVPSEPVELAFRTSVHSYAVLGELLAALAPPTGASLVGLHFDASRAWPTYNWMGVCKAALESANGYLARDLGARGIRANLIAAGPLQTRAASAIPGFDLLLDSWAERAPLAWDPRDATPVADTACFLLSDLARAITGSVVQVDAGHHAMA